MIFNHRARKGRERTARPGFGQLAGLNFKHVADCGIPDKIRRRRADVQNGVYPAFSASKSACAIPPNEIVNAAMKIFVCFMVHSFREISGQRAASDATLAIRGHPRRSPCDRGRRRTCWRYSAGSSTRSGGVIRKQERSCTRIRPEIRGRRSRVRAEASQPSIPKGLRRYHMISPRHYLVTLARDLVTEEQMKGFTASAASRMLAPVFFSNRNPAPPDSLTCRRHHTSRRTLWDSDVERFFGFWGYRCR